MTHSEREMETIRRLQEQIASRREAFAELGLCAQTSDERTISLDDRAEVVTLESMR